MKQERIVTGIGFDASCWEVIADGCKVTIFFLERRRSRLRGILDFSDLTILLDR